MHKSRGTCAWRNAITRIKSGRTLAGTTLFILATLAASAALAQYRYGGYPNPAFDTGPSVLSTLLYRFGILLVAGVLGFATGALFSPALKTARKFIGAGIALFVVLFALFGPSLSGTATDIVVSIILFFVAIAFGLRLGAKVAAQRKRPRPTSFGSAKWADLAHLRDNEVIGSAGFMLGTFREEEKTNPLCYRGARHLMTVAPTRSGKGVSSVIPNLLAYEGSVLVIDPKGENALVTAYRRGAGSEEHKIEGLGQDVLLLDPWDIAATQLGLPRARFNPLDWIKPKDPDAAENAFLLAEALVPMDQADAEGEARFWNEEAKALLTGIILYVATSPKESKKRNLGRVRDILVQGDEGLKETLEAMYKHPDPVVRSTAARTAEKDPKLRSNVLAGAQSHTHFLDSPRIRESLAKSDFGFEELKSSHVTVYLILPADRLKTFDRWLRLLIQQAITVNARNIDQTPEKPILFLLDEMATLGRLPAVEQAFGLMAGFGMQLWGIVQDLSQLARIYGETGWQTFISNSGVIQYFGSRDKMTAEYFSTLCGVTTVEVHNFSWAVGEAFSYFSSLTSSHNNTSDSSGSSQNISLTSTSGTNEAQRQLAYPDELMVLKGHQQIVFIENLDPVSGEKVIWYDDPVLKRLGVNLRTDTLSPVHVHVPVPLPAPPSVPLIEG